MKDIIKRIFVKLTSSKVLITIAAMVLLYIIVCKNLTEFKEIGYICASCIPCYLGANVIQKKLEDKTTDGEDK